MTDLDVIQENLGTGSAGEGHGAYQCEYAVFKRLVQLERRGVERSGDSVYLCLLTVGDRKGRTLKPEIQARAMERLRASIQKSLRSSDVYARYSVSQFILLPMIWLIMPYSALKIHFHTMAMAAGATTMGRK